MANLQFTSDILDDVLFRAGEPTDGTSDFHEQTLQYINRAYRAIWMGGGEFVPGMNEPWLWLKKDPPGTLILQPIVEGVVSVTNNSATITFAETIPTSMEGRFFTVDTFPDVFRISTHTAGTASATLDSVFTGPTSSAAAFTIRKLEYELAADFLRLVSPMRIYDNEGKSEAEGIDLVTLDHAYPLHEIATGIPTHFALVTETKVRFNRAGGVEEDELIRVEYDYHVQPADLTDSGSEEPLVPLQHRQVLADIALFYLLVAKSDSRADAVGLQAKAGLQAMQSDNRSRLQQSGRSVGMIFQRQNQMNRSRLLRTSSGHIVGF